ncbi:helix-turn-helix domain-containing protein [Nonomuraea sp. NPDC049709]|uniref:TetR/AcrR family transcriptional regulator n=1 Tax=Nonomuraea sp. NPDC049709 TaxID=3154736 RepID=UPI00341EC4EB
MALQDPSLTVSASTSAAVLTCRTAGASGLRRHGSSRSDPSRRGDHNGRAPVSSAEATRQALLEAVRARFIRLGYDRTTLRDVAADVGVNLALIKRYFDSKEGLFKAALASASRFPGGDDRFPENRAALAAALSRQLSAGAWPEFSEHPALMLLRVSGDERVDSLRRQALQDFSRQILEASGDPGPREDDGEPLRGAGEDGEPPVRAPGGRRTPCEGAARR